ncbi:hypothetical protein ACFL96_14355, partial [Thermoproteota archaeon]
LVDSNYKVFIVHMNLFDNVPEGNVGESEYTKQDIITALRSDNVRKWFIEETLEQIEIPEEYKEHTEEFNKIAKEQIEKEAPPDHELRTLMFFLLFAAASENQGPAFIIEEHRAGRIEIYPKTAMFIFIDIVPDFIFERSKPKE